MKRINQFLMLLIFIITPLTSETLFEVKDASNNKVLDISTDGLRVMNLGDTLMVISASEIKANLDNSKGLSRSFSVSTTSSVKGSETDLMRLTGDSTRFWISDTGSGFGVASNSNLKSVSTNVFEVSTTDARLREGNFGEKYTDFSPENIFLGLNAGVNTTPTDSITGANNVFLGNRSGYSNLGGGSNVYIGTKSGYLTQNTFQNTFVGYRSGYSLLSACNSVFGSLAGENAGGWSNSFFGFSAGKSATGGENSFFGENAGYLYPQVNSGTKNTYMGLKAGSYTTSGSNNVCMGYEAGLRNQAGSNNTLIGYWAGKGTADHAASNNVFIGAEAGRNSNSSIGNVFIGYQAGYNETLSNKLYIDNSSTTLPLLYGDFGTNMLTINGKMGIQAVPSSLYGLYVYDGNTAILSAATTTSSATVTAVYAYSAGSTTQNLGINTCALNGGSSENIGIYSYAAGGSSNWAGYFEGSINVTGSVVKSADKLRIDHPLDPENKYLNHSSVSSDEMKNIYDGIAILDGSGKAVVVLPDWFEALNSEFRYQMTAIGAPGPNLFISKEVSNNSFEIAGGAPGMKVSWMITGTRNDNYAKTNQMQIEEDKSTKEKGYYINPESFGLPAEKGIKSLYQKDMKTVTNDIGRQ